MTTNQMIDLLSRKEVNATYAADYRRLLMTERLTIMSRLQARDFAGAQEAVREAQRVINMWESP